MSASGNSQEVDTAVIGGGVIGTAIAFRLARRNIQTALLDPMRPETRASFGNAGHIATEQIFPLASMPTMRSVPSMLLRRNSPLSVRPAYAFRILPWLLRFAWCSRPSAFRRGTEALSSLQSRALGAMQNLCHDAGLDDLFHSRGHMIIAESESAAKAARTQQSRYDDHGIAATWLAAPEVAERVPQLTRKLAGALLMHGTAHVDNPQRVCDGLLDAFRSAGGTVMPATVKSLHPESDGGFRVRWQGSELKCRKLVIAAGAWSRPLARDLGCDVPLDTERGYNVCADGWHGDVDVSIASLDRMTIMTPMDVGMRITGFVELGGLDLPPRQASIDRLEQHLRELFPKEDLPKVSHWLGFRPSLPDHLPVIGESPEHEHAYFAFGHQHLGLTLAGITADIIDAQIQSEPLPVDLKAFRVDRFR